MTTVSLVSAMAATVTLSFSLEPHPHHLHRHLCSTTSFRPRQTPVLTPQKAHRLVFFPKFGRHNPTLSFSSSHPSSSTSSFSLQDPFRTGRFHTNEGLQKLQFLGNFSYYQELKSGSMWVRVMKPEEIDMVVALISESFAESIMFLAGYATLLGILVKPYLIERRALMPHTAMLVGLYREGDDEDLQIAGAVEVCFDGMGANAYTPTPTPPKDSPYVCNMTVKKPLRRRGIGWHLLKASEQLISQMSSSREVYLHCRMVDAAPLNMYAKAGYRIVKTDSILILLTLQRRKHLMRKELLVLDSPDSLSNISDSNEELTS